MEFLRSSVNLDNHGGNKSAVDKVTEYLKEKILFKELRPGDRIPTESELCQILDVGRGSVREALKILEAINLIHIRRGDGTYISNPEDVSFSESLLFKMILGDLDTNSLIEFREQIEIAVIKLAITHATPRDLEELHRNYKEFNDSIKSRPEDSERLHDLDYEFHKLLAHSTRNTLIEEIYLFSFKIFSPLIRENYSIGQVMGEDGQVTLETHRMILEALEKKDLYAGIHGVRLTLSLWSKWMEKQVKKDRNANT